MIEFEDFIFLDKEEYETAPLKLLTGKFKDVIICYGRVKIVENPNNTATLQFTYKFVAPKDKQEQKKLEANSDFKNHLGNILNHIILESNNPNESRENYIEEPDNKRGVLKKGRALS